MVIDCASVKKTKSKSNVVLLISVINEGGNDKSEKELITFCVYAFSYMDCRCLQQNSFFNRLTGC